MVRPRALSNKEASSHRHQRSVLQTYHVRRWALVGGIWDFMCDVQCTSCQGALIVRETMVMSRVYKSSLPFSCPISFKPLARSSTLPESSNSACIGGICTAQATFKLLDSVRDSCIVERVEYLTPSVARLGLRFPPW